MPSQSKDDAQHKVSLGNLTSIKTLPPFPAVAARLLAAIADQDVGLREVSDLIVTDTALSSQVLRLANSALFAFRTEVKNLLGALCLLGANRVRDMVITVAMKGYAGPGDSPMRRAFWRHSLATALWAEVISRSYGLNQPVAYTAGILHDLGRIALLKVSPEGSTQFFERASESTDRDFRPLEQAIFTTDHCRVGGYLSQTWKFQPVLTDAIAHHHDPVTPHSPEERVLIQTACRAASASGFHSVGPGWQWDPAELEGLLPETRNLMRPDLDKMRQTVGEQINLVESSLL